MSLDLVIEKRLCLKCFSIYELYAILGHRSLVSGMLVQYPVVDAQPRHLEQILNKNYTFVYFIAAVIWHKF